jgi:hypothetical protein
MLVYLIQELARGELLKLQVDLCHTSVLWKIHHRLFPDHIKTAKLAQGHICPKNTGSDYCQVPLELRLSLKPTRTGRRTTCKTRCEIFRAEEKPA